jgi:AraC family transcriptional regulator
MPKSILSSSTLGAVIGQRVERAKVLISERKLTLAEVAAVAGFSDQSQFAKHFRRIVGCTPGRYGGIRQE